MKRFACFLLIFIEFKSAGQTIKFGFPVDAICISPDEKKIAISDSRKSMILSIDGGAIYYNESTYFNTQNIRFTLDNKRFIFQKGSNAILFDLIQKKELQSFSMGPKRQVAKLYNEYPFAFPILKRTFFSQFGTSVLFQDSDSNVLIYDVFSNVLKRTYKSSREILDLNFGNQNEKIKDDFVIIEVDSSLLNAIYINDLGIGIKSLNEFIKTTYFFKQDKLDPSKKNFSYSSDFKKIAVGSFEDYFTICDVSTKLEKKVIAHNSSITTLTFSPDGKTIASGSTDKTVKLWDSETGIQKGETLLGHSDFIDLILFSPDGSLLLTKSWDNEIKIWDVDENTEIQSLKIENSMHISFSNDSKKIRIATNNYLEFKPIDFSKEKKNIRISSTKIDINPTTIVNPQTENSIFWRTPNSSEYSKTNPLKVKTPILTLDAIIISSNLLENQIESNIQVKVNGRLQTGSKLKNVKIKPQAKSLDFRCDITLEENLNIVEISINIPNKETILSTKLFVFYTPPLKANLYLFTFGVQHTDLNFTDEDAQTIHRLFKSQSGSLYNQVFTDIPFINDKTDTKTLAQELESLGYREDIREQDVVLIFGSSHGDVINDDFRILGSDWRTNAPRNSSLSFRDDFIANLNNLKCKKIILLDACHSGASVGKRLADANQIIANTPAGTITITSSSGNEKSYEHSAWKNSSFVKAIKEALEEGKANTNRDSYITIEELYNYLKSRVPKLVQSIPELKNSTQNPQIKKEGIEDFPIYLLK